jgi:hypothetical protein
MFDLFARISLAYAFFDQYPMVFLKLRILRYSFIDNKASIPLLCFRDGV